MVCFVLGLKDFSLRQPHSIFKFSFPKVTIDFWSFLFLLSCIICLIYSEWAKITLNAITKGIPGSMGKTV